MIPPIAYRCLGLALLLSPALHAASPEALARQFFTDPDMANVSLSPNGTYLAYEGKKDDRKALYTLNLATNKGTAAVGEGRFEVVDGEWIDDHKLGYNLTADDAYIGGGNERGTWLEWYYLDAAKGKTVYISGIGGQRNQRHNVEQVQPPIFEGHHYNTLALPYLSNRALGIEVFFEGKAQQHYKDLYMYDLEKPSRTLWVTNPGNVSGWIANQATGEVNLGYIDTGFQGGELIYRKDAASPWNKLDLPGRSFALGYLTPEKLLITTSGDQAHRGLATYTLETQATSKITRQAPYDFYEANPVYMTGKAQIAGITYTTDKLRTLWFVPEYKQLAKVIDGALPDAQNQILGIINEGKTVLILSRSDRNPGQLYKLQLEEGKLEPWLKLKSSIKPEAMCAMEPIEFKARDGATVYGYLTRPKNASGPVPLIASIVGGPRQRVSPEFDSETQFLAALGYAVLQVNYRGCDGYGLEYLGEDISQPLGNSRSDTIDGVKWAVEQGIADKDRLAVMGWSFGGYAALGCVLDEPGLFRCVMGAAGVYDWPAMLKDKESTPRNLGWVDGLFEGYNRRSETLVKMSITPRAAEIKVPVMLFHGELDSVVTPLQSRNLKSALSKAGVPVTLSTPDYVLHGVQRGKEKDRIELYTQLAAFLAQHLGK